MTSLIDAAAVIGVSAYRRQSAFKIREIDDILETIVPVADTPLRQPTITVKSNFYHICTNNASFATGNERTGNDVSCLKMPIAADRSMR